MTKETSKTYSRAS